MEHTHPLIEMRGIRKSFGSVEVLHGADFRVLPGEVHVLAGENGAGKSTLIKIISGAYDDFLGEMYVLGIPHRFSRPSKAVEAGIATIHQELSLVPSMSISDNLFLGQERTRSLSRMDFRMQALEARKILTETDMEFPPEQLVEELPIAAQQTLEIARALARDASLVVFDEPTSALGEHEVESLFRRIMELKSRGRGIVYITHKMEEIYRLADRITVLRDGRVVGTGTASELPPDELVRLMVGRDLGGAGGPGTEPSADVALEVEKLRITHPHIRGQSVVDGVSFRLRRGEILGLAGLQGSGKSEVLHALFGALEGRVSGTAILSGHPLPFRNPGDSVKRGLVLLANDRKGLGLAPEMGVTHNVSLASLDRFSTRSGWMNRAREQREVEGLARDFGLKAPSLDAPVRTLSGGNQQKAYLARCLLPGPKVLLLDEPTRGIDVGAKADIYDLMEQWIREGASILLITSEMDELLSLSHRILVMHRGRMTAEFSREAASKDGVLAAAMGHEGREA